MKLVVISIDALDSNELERELENLPTLKKFISEGTLISNVKGVFPSCTYPSHTSMITGKEPYQHGIERNSMVDPFNDEQIWYWHYKYIKSHTIFDDIKAKGYSCATVFWPVCAGLDIEYCVPEIWKHEGKSSIHHILENGNSKFIKNSVFKSALTFYEFTTNSEHNLDKLTTDAFINALKKNVDVAFLHLLELDTTKHKRGNNNKYTKQALVSIDKKLHKIFKYINDDCNVIIVGDHSHKDTSKNIDLNSIFKERGYINDDKKTFRVYAHSNDGSAELFVEPVLEDKVLEIINETKGIKNIIKAPKEAKCSYYLDAEDDYFFASTFTEKSYSQHGYHPDRKNYQTITIFKGKSFTDYDVESHRTIKDNYKLFKKGLDV